MCTIVILNQVHDAFPLIIGANRDESYDRPSKEPDYIQLLDVAAVAPEDGINGGTWIGAAQGSWFVALTNQDEGPTVFGKKSRGKIVRDCLLMGDHRQVTRYLVGLNANDYNPFNIVFGRPGAVFLCKVHNNTPTELDIIPKGVTVIANDCTELKRYNRRENRALKGARLINDGDTEDAILSKLEKTLSSHDGGDDPYQSLCIHDDKGRFGTKSTAAVLMSNDGSVDYYHSEGHLCVSSGLSLRCHLPSIDNAKVDIELIQSIVDDDVDNLVDW